MHDLKMFERDQKKQTLRNITKSQGVRVTVVTVANVASVNGGERGSVFPLTVM